MSVVSGGNILWVEQRKSCQLLRKKSLNEQKSRRKNKFRTIQFSGKSQDNTIGVVNIRIEVREEGKMSLKQM